MVLSPEPASPAPAPAMAPEASRRAADDPSGRSVDRPGWRGTDFLLVFLTLVMASAAAVTAYQRHQRQAVQRQLARELTAVADAVRAYMREHDRPPPDSAPGQMPEGLAPFLPRFDWSRPTPVGGLYRLTHVPPRFSSDAPQVQLEVTAFPPAPPLRLSAEQWAALDREVDDGNPATGRLRVGFGGWPTLTLLGP